MAHRDRIKGWLDDDELTVVKVHELLGRRGVDVPYRTLARFAADELGLGRPQRTVCVDDGEPGGEVQIDYGRLGPVWDRLEQRRRVLWALVFTAVVSRHLFVWCSWRQTTEDVIGGCEAAWAFFGGIFAVVMPEYVPRNIFVVMRPAAYSPGTEWATWERR